MKINSQLKSKVMTTTKRKINTLLFIVTGISTGFAQNLVINPNMEAKEIRNGYGEIIKTETWTNANGGTVDLFDGSKTRKYSKNGIPVNYMGHQASLKGEQNYAGIIAFYDDGNDNKTDSSMTAALGIKDGYKMYSEYLQGELVKPLVAGKTYQISFKVSLAEKSARAVSCLGVLLTATKIEEKTNTFLTQKPQFISYRIISDTVNWVTISGAYIATGNEKFITIGCFKNESFREEKIVKPLTDDSRKAYYYVTAVSVAPYIAKPDMESIVYGVDYAELMDLQFASGSAVIAPQFNGELDEVAAWMKKHPKMVFFVAGYTDNTGTNSINEPLSVNRAKEVKKYLIKKGVKEANLVTEGFGSSDPIEYKIKSRRNRRVEIYLMSVSKK